MTEENTAVMPPTKKENKNSDKVKSKKPEKFSLSHAWFLAHGWQPFAFQQQVWQDVAQGKSGMLHATTGAGKTYAVWLAAIERFAQKKKPAQQVK